MKKILSIAMVVVLVALLQVSALAATIEVDAASPEFTCDTWQNNVDNTAANEICKLENTLATTPTTPDAGIDALDIYRYCACLQVGAGGIEGTPVIVDGNATSSVVFPLKETANIDSVSMKFNNSERQFFCNIYVSVDGQNWTLVDITSGANKTTLANAYDETGGTAGPGGINCFATIPAGRSDINDINIITLGFAGSPEAKYIKITAYGSDGGSGDATTVSNAWWSFNNFSVEGNVAAIVEEAAAVEAPAAQTLPAEIAPVVVGTVTAPQTSDAGIMFAIIGLVCLAGVVTFAKKQHN
jgi:hypothetical protein